MNVDINEINSTVRTVDSASLTSPEMMAKIVAAATQTMQDKMDHAKRADAERRLTQGVWAESGKEQA